jgi:hypothetical protein
VEHFEKYVRPVLVEKCIACHGAAKQRGGLRLDSADALRKGGDSGPAVVPGKPEQSLILKAVRREGDLKMPPKEKLPAAVAGALAEWIRNGAPYPAGFKASPAVSAVSLARKQHWSFRPVRAAAPPAVRDTRWPRTPVDRFVLAKLEARGLAPSAAAAPRTMVRRLTLDLTGLPPTPDEVEAFAHDARPDAYERLVDRLLASPAYGERWGRHWLDVARYADTRGYVFTAERRYPYSYTYRDYVVGAFNADLPYDRFVVEQLAADKLPLGDDRRPLAAMGFLTLGRRFLGNVHDVIDDRIDVVTRGLMGLTVACARCHDHKFDPVPTRDYYSLHGVFASSVEPAELPLLVRRDPAAAPTSFERRLRSRQAAVDRYLKEQQEKLAPALRAQAADYLLATASAGRSRRGQGRDGLRPALVRRWRAYLNGPGKQSPVLSAWRAFAGLPRGDFAARAEEVARRVAAGKALGKPVNPLVAKAFAGPAPKSLAEVARRYGQLFAEAEAAWKNHLPGATSLPSADQEAVRRVLYGPDAPTTVPLDELERLFDQGQRQKVTALRKQVLLLQATAPDAPARAMVLTDAPNPVQARVLVRGNPGNPGVAVPRQFLEVLAGEGRKPFTQGSGRLDLAKAVASPDNPLTARVMVNRVWQHHFGAGLVRTPGDFGLRGEPPTHPELLDYLAAEFVRSGWSVKHLHRLILRSAAYRQGSDDNATALLADPENRLLWRVNRQRLEFEPLRDSLLAVAGKLDRNMGGRAVDITQAPFPPRRSVYGFIDRQNLPGLFRTFDLASPDTATPQRHVTTVPQQALFLMNSPFVLDLARAFAGRPEVLAERTDEGRIDRMHRLAYGRAAEPDEVALGLRFLRESKGTGPSLWEQYAQVLLLANELAFVD